MYKSIRELKEAVRKNPNLKAVIDLNDIEQYRNPADRRSYLMKDNRSYQAAVKTKDGSVINMWHVYPVAIDDVQVHIVCPYCGYIHHHGAAGGYEGARVPHCTNGSNLTCYIIVKPE